LLALQQHQDPSVHPSILLLLLSLLCCCITCRFDSGIKLWLPNISQPRPNLAVFQLNFAAPAEFDLVLLTQPDSSTQHARLEALHGEEQSAQ
jgi:hypothetical protein